MPLPRATVWAKNRALRELTKSLLVSMGFDPNRVETSLFRYERGYPPRDEFESDTFKVFEHMNNLHRQETSTNGGVKEGN